ncbi:MAG: DUF1565 domain-containing protein [Phycisphaerales bacterium]|nr:DUF1565 domain-containing protein [Phycisphaerales bacterium]
MVTSLHARVLHVSVNGTSNGDGSAERPLRTIQSALDQAGAGDTILVSPGVYQERVKFKRGGEFGKPLILEGQPGAVIDGSNPVNTKWEPAFDVAPGVYRIKLDFEPFTITADGKGVTLLDENRVGTEKDRGSAWHPDSLFKNGIEGRWSGVGALTMWRHKTKDLIIRFDGMKDPRQMKFTFAPREPVVLVEGVDRVVLRGLEIRNGSYGVFVKKSLGTVVENCNIIHDFGIWLDSETDRCTLRFNQITLNALGVLNPKKKVESWDNWTAHKRGGFYDRHGINLRCTIGGHEIHDNTIDGHWNGIHDMNWMSYPMDEASRDANIEMNKGLRVHHNLIMNLTDDALEPNSGAIDSHWHHNMVINVRCAVRIKGIDRGPLYVYRNIFIGNNEDLRNYGAKELRRAVAYVYHNTCTSLSAINDNKIQGIGVPDIHFYNNLFLTGRWWGNLESMEPNWKSDYNVFVLRTESKNWKSGIELATRLDKEQHSLWHEGPVGLFVENYEQRDFRLTADSPARKRGIDLSKIYDGKLPGTGPGYFTGELPMWEPCPMASRCYRSRVNLRLYPI